MYIVKDSTHIDAPIDRVFRLSTSVDIVRLTLGMTPVKGRTTGLILPNDTVEWRGWIFGLPQRHVTLITGYDAPTFFQDTQLRGRFAHFHHDHHLEEVGGHVFAHDKVYFALPFGPLGKLVARHILIPHITKLLARRFALLKRLAETEAWRPYLTP